MTQEELHDQIKEHLSTFPERYKDVQEMQQEWREFKARFFWAVIGCFSMIISVGIWVGTMQADHKTFQLDLTQADNKHALYESRLNNLEVNNSEIKARLVSIEVTLQEIKTAILKLQ